MIRSTYLNLLCAILIVAGGSMDVYAQTYTYQVDHYSVEEGLTDHRTRSLLIHEDGFVYVGTMRGLSRFDGYGFTTVMLQTEDGQNFTEYHVHHLHPGDQGLIYVLGSAQEHSPLIAITLDPENGEIRGVEELELRWSDMPETLTIDGHEIHPNRPLHGFYMDSMIDANGNALIMDNGTTAASASAMLYLKNDQQFDLSRTILSTGSYVTVFSKYLDEVIYLTTNNNGLVKISLTPSEFQNMLSDEVEGWQYKMSCRAVAEIDGRAVIGTYTKGLYIQSLEDGTFDPVHLFSDAPGNVRLTSEIRGLHPTAERALFAATLRPLVLSVDVDAGTYRPMYVPKGHALHHSVLLEDGRIVSCQTSETGEEGWISIIDPASGQMFEWSTREMGWPRQHTENVLGAGGNDIIWLGTTSGLLKVDIARGEVLEVFLGQDDTFRPDSPSVPVKSVLSSSHIIALEQQGNKLWIGLFAQGVDILDLTTGEVEHLDKDAGLPNNTACALLPDTTGMWIATFNGLAHYNTTSGAISRFSMDNGLSHNEFNRWSGYISPSGEYFLGTMNGVTHFNPEHILAKEGDLKLLLSEVGYYSGDGQTPIIQNTTLGARPTFAIPSTNRSFYANVALSDMRRSELGTYSSRLIQGNVPSKWRNHGTDRQIRFEHLPAGVHHLEIRAVSASGLAATEALVIVLKVKQHFYLRAWFIATVFLTIIGISWLFYKYRLHQSLKVERLRTKLSSDLHDDVGGLLSGVALQMEVLEHTVPEESRPLVRSIAGSSRLAMEKMRDVVWAIDARQQTLLDLRERMLEFTEKVLDPLDLGYSVEMDGDMGDRVLSSEVRHNLLLIYKEFVNNSIKHSGCDRVDAWFRHEGGSFIMGAQDNGQGHSENGSTQTGQGLRNMRMRVEKINGQIKFKNEGGFGIEVYLPQ